MNLDKILKHTSRTLYLSVKILPSDIRPAFSVAYLLCRYADTIADSAKLPLPRKIHWVTRFPEIIRSIKTDEQEQLVKELSGKSTDPYENALIQQLGDCKQALRSISFAFRPLVYEVVKSVCEGMLIDFKTFPTGPKDEFAVSFAEGKDLINYCHLMGGKPGLFWSKLIYLSLPVAMERDEFFTRAEYIGEALQIVNILRDLPQDLRRGRCYIPATDLQQYRLTTKDLLLTRNSARFKPIRRKWIHWGKNRLEKALEYYQAIPKSAWRVRAAVAWPILWTADTFAKIDNTIDLLNPTKRVKISRKTIYFTLLVTPFFLVSNRLFSKWLEKKLNKLP